MSDTNLEAIDHVSLEEVAGGDTPYTGAGRLIGGAAGAAGGTIAGSAAGGLVTTPTVAGVPAGVLAGGGAGAYIGGELGAKAGGAIADGIWNAGSWIGEKVGNWLYPSSSPAPRRR